MILRTYQNESIASTYEKWKEYQRVLAVLATGTGKTLIFSNIAAIDSSKGKNVLILCNRDILIEQAVHKLKLATGLDCVVEKADQTSIGKNHKIVVGSVQTLMRQTRLEKFSKNHFQTLIIDECDLCLADSWQRILSYFDKANVLGVTGSPQRADKKSLGRYFECLAYEYGLRKAIEEGYLCRIVANTQPLKIDISQVEIKNGDYDLGQIDNALDKYLPHIAHKIPMDRKTLIFTPLCSTALKLQGILKGLCRRAYYSSGEDKSQIDAWESDGTGSIMLCSQLLGRGYDHPPIDHIVNLRVTRSLTAYQQAIGRGTRIHPGKQNLLLTDYLYQSERHDLCRPASLIAETREIAEKMQRVQDKAGGPIDLDFMEDVAKRDVIRDREEALARALREQRNKESRLIDPLSFAVMIKDEKLMEETDTWDWEKQPASYGQLNLLKRFGIDSNKIRTKGAAKRLIDCIINRNKRKLATPGQAQVLNQAGYYTTDMTRKHACDILTELKANKWRVSY